MKPLLIAHRGDTNNFAENTMEAFASAFSKGADGIELDTQEQDGEMIVVHNYLYDKTKVYPKLSDVLKQFAAKGRLEIEIKSLDLGFIKPLQKVLMPYAGANIELTTSVVGLFNYIRATFKDFQLGVIFQDREFEDWMSEEGFSMRKIVKLMQLYDANIAHIPFRIANIELVNSLHQLGMKAHVPIPRQQRAVEVQNYQQLQELSIDQSTIDDIELITELARLQLL